MLITPLILRATEIYLIVPEKLTFWCILDYLRAVGFFAVMCFIWKERVWLFLECNEIHIFISIGNHHTTFILFVNAYWFHSSKTYSKLSKAKFALTIENLRTHFAIKSNSCHTKYWNLRWWLCGEVRTQRWFFSFRRDIIEPSLTVLNLFQGD